MNPSLNLSERDRAVLEDFARRARQTTGPNLVALKLFGSKATGHAAPDSDLDVLVLVREVDASIEDGVLDVAFHVNLAHDVYISPRIIAEVTLDEPVWATPASCKLSCTRRCRCESRAGSAGPASPRASADHGEQSGTRHWSMLPRLVTLHAPLHRAR